MPQQHPHPKPLRRGDTAVPPSPSREPLRVGTAALAAHAGPGIHSPAGAGTHQESPTGAGTHQKLPSRPTLIKKAPARGGSRCKGSGEREPPPTGAFQYSASILPLVDVGDSSHEEILVHAKGRVEGQADDASVFANVLLGQSHAKGSHAFAKIGLEAG